MKIEKIKPGMVLYDVGRQKMGNTTMSTVAVWRVYVKDVDLEKRLVTACWNGNSARTYTERQFGKWRSQEPVLVKSGLGKRLATRAELAAMKEVKP